MKFATTATMFSSLVASASAFGVRHRHTMIGKRAFVSATKPLRMANVLKLSDPQTQLLDKVDVFIFDCDGVIWRVRIHVKSSERFGSRRLAPFQTVGLAFFQKIKQNDSQLMSLSMASVFSYTICIGRLVD
jgi:hypothetical protein